MDFQVQAANSRFFYALATRPDRDRCFHPHPESDRVFEASIACSATPKSQAYQYV
ncbi:hypothetical protein NIES2135_21390 [Leptolyngbya boryana NIES-2135]|jgi:hypothetical protein|uniref:Uncharacterized protein n=1 Tax=Leptolyngbya boryana NIES-2135 TaxID=1973484 RepID=A0A1Z4JEZ8_LEPBY|nr:MULTISPECIES: hypothetical protein [Leptolyngbya]MBD2401727.1 hypothetical protein [Leptolyngbya sp. FACHB-239]MBD2406534.1 hypothetical protein [Leptolyngbya sp. FACHB-402]ULP32215.1 hypothetical protein MCP04_10700 [Leptolyngbya boryana IU 594]BAY55316.1 hypothetical protein NIES2135_21390 [Leptolyngbya boryana NIES-2135]